MSAAAYVAFYETLTPRSLARMEDLVAADVHFRDPFNDVHGIEPYRRVLAKMFADVPDVRFTVSRHGAVGDLYVLRWRCAGHIRALGAKEWAVDGMSELRFAPDGRVREHFDYWDAAQGFYERLPLIGAVMRLIRRKVAAH